MHQLYYQPKGYWFGDCMPFCKDGVFYLYHQRDTRNPEPFGEPFGWALATTTDFVHYRDYGESLKGGGNEAQDQFIFAGSVFEAGGIGHAFYTGFNRDYPALGRPSQVLMHATSTDFVNWEKSQQALTFVPQEGYDPDDWRDPFVLWDQERQEYLLILGTRKRGDKKQLTGRTVQFTSKDLEHWDFGGDFWAPDIYTMHEMPDLFRIGEWWYLIISEYSDKNKIIYRRSKSLKGPWTAPADDAFDGRAYYAGRTFTDGQRRILFGWVPTKEQNNDLGNYEWGGTFVAHEVYQRPDGTLGVRVPDTVWRAFSDWKAVSDVKLQTVDSRKEHILAKDCGVTYSFEATVRFGKGTRSIGLKLLENEETGEAYEYFFPLGEHRMVFDKTPNMPWYQYMNKGLERPLPLEAEKEYCLRLIVDDTIATLYIDGVALNARMYTRPGNCLSMYVTDGMLEISDAAFSNTLNK